LARTTSTKSSRSKQAPAQKKTAGEAKYSTSPGATIENGGRSDRAWRISVAAILLIGAVLRFYRLSLVPFHHDEGVNGNFLVPLVREGLSKYQYNPENYHGPTLYFFSAVVPWLARFFGGKSFGDTYGLNDYTVRGVTAIFGIATIGLVLLLRKRLGTIGALSAAALIAISPGAVYLSRYFIHESLFVFFTLGIVVAALKYYDSGRGVYLILTGISAALMVATKETWIMNGPVLLIALFTTTLYFSLRARLDPQRGGSDVSLSESWGRNIERLGGAMNVTTFALLAFAAFIAVAVLFYSSFFTNYPKGVRDALQTLNLWKNRTHEHEHPWSQYLSWLIQEEGVIVLLGGIGALISVWRADNRLGLFVAQWSFGLLAAYSLVGYKTPWICLNFIVPLALTSGYALESGYQKLREFGQPRLLLAAALVIVAICGYQMYELNFVHYDDDQYAYVYAHTRRGMLSMLAQIDHVATQMKTGTDTGISIVSPDYWPLPWYFRDFKRVGYYQQIVPTTEPIIIGSKAQEEQLKANYGDRYQLIRSGEDEGAFALRPGVDLLLYVRRDVAR
jgi:uncharacterized protein (TIGR03663 family)